MPICGLDISLLLLLLLIVVVVSKDGGNVVEGWVQSGGQERGETSEGWMLEMKPLKDQSVPLLDT
jgi:hypothetical protein